LIIEYGQVRTENSNNPHGFGVLEPTSSRQKYRLTEKDRTWLKKAAK
jgi:hypothetical protein